MSEISNSKKNSNKILIQTIFLLRLKALIGLVTGEKRRLKFTVNPEKLSEDLEKLQALFSLLRTDNKSRDPEFLEEISLAWQKIKKNCFSLDKASPKSGSTEKMLQEFIQSVEHFPEGTDFTLSYFLSREVGDEWSPLHFMEILKGLHVEYLEKPDSSQLAIWIERIEAILDEIVF